LSGGAAASPSQAAASGKPAQIIVNQIQFGPPLPAFPIPVHEGCSSLWHPSPVLAWLHERAHYAIPSTLLDVANIAMQINLAKEARQIEHSLQREPVELFAQKRKSHFRG
jgi:hypothetical protein